MPRLLKLQHPKRMQGADRALIRAWYPDKEKRGKRGTGEEEERKNVNKRRSENISKFVAAGSQ